MGKPYTKEQCTNNSYLLYLHDQKG